MDNRFVRVVLERNGSEKVYDPKKYTKEYWVNYLKDLENYHSQVIYENKKEEIEASNYIELIKKCIENEQWIGPRKESTSDFTKVKRIVQTSWLNTEDIDFLWTYGGLYVEVEGYFISRDTFKNKVVMSDNGVDFKKFWITLPSDATNVVLTCMGGLFIPLHSPIADRLGRKRSHYLDITI